MELGTRVRDGHSGPLERACEFVLIRFAWFVRRRAPALRRWIFEPVSGRFRFSIVIVFPSRRQKTACALFRIFCDIHFHFMLF